MLYNANRERRFNYGGKVFIIEYGKNTYGRELIVKGVRHKRTAYIYTNCNNKKKFGVLLQEYYNKPVNNSWCRWTGGKCIGFYFSYNEARKAAIIFVTRNIIRESKI